MIDFGDFHIQGLIHEGADFRVYAGRWNKGDKPIILKELKEERLSADTIARLHLEYDVLRSHALPSVPPVIALERYRNTFVLVSEYACGVSMRDLIRAGSPGVKEALHVAIACVRALAPIHAAGLIHRAIRPEHILYHAEDASSVFVDFQVAIRPGHASANGGLGDQLPQNLRYLAPELTGRINSHSDGRADFYALGASLYELLTGTPPFTEADPLELIHRIIARLPEPPIALNPALPQSLSDIVMKLLAKNPESRYQSIPGLLVDLTHCLRLYEQGLAETPFTTGRYDSPFSLTVGARLYGRNREIKAVETAFSRVADGACEMLMITGYAGVGKTSLIENVQPTLAEQGALWASGKFDQMKRDVPYTALVDAFQKLVRQLLTESDDVLRSWRHRIESHMGGGIQPIIDVIPELELITGPQPALEKLSATETKNRFVQAFLRFIQAFCQKGRPLILFIDDLQWMDSGSMAVLDAVMNHSDLRYLLILGAYRDNEVDACHPLRVMLDSMHTGSAQLQELHLAPLRRDDVVEMLTDAMEADRPLLSDLADVLHHRTQGNPFFLKEFLRSLQQRDLLRYHAEQGCWQWDIEAIRSQQMPNDIVDLLIENIRQLPQQTQRLLQHAACVGNRFELGLLSTLSDLSQQDAAAALSQPTRLGLITPLGANQEAAGAPVQCYAFAHDRIQQAAYLLLSEQESQHISLRIGRLLLSQLAADDERLFDAISHVNRALPLIDQPQERLQFARLNLESGRKARNAAAFQTAYQYFSSGLALLGKRGWDEHHDLQLALSTEAADAAHLAGHLDDMHRLFDDVNAHAKTLLDKIKIHEIAVQAAIELNDLQRALHQGLDALRLMGVRIPANPSVPYILWQVLKTKSKLRRISFEDMLNLPAMTDPYHLAQMRIGKLLLNVAYWTNPNLLPVLILSQLRLVLRHGNSAQAPMTYGAYGMLLCGVLNDIETGYRFGRLALQVLERYPSKDEEARTRTTVAIFTTHWKDHVRETLKPCLEAFQIGFESGNLQYAGYAAFGYCINSFHSGKELNILAREMEKYSGALLGTNQVTTFYGNELYHQTVLNLLGRANDPCRLVGERYNEDKMLPVHEKAKDLTDIFILNCNKLILNYLLGRHESALDCANKARRYVDAAVGSFSIPLFFFYEALACIAMIPACEPQQQQGLRWRARKNARKLKRMASHAPANNLHKYLLVEAEYRRVVGRDKQEAARLYHEAIRLANENGFIQEEGLAYELGARFYFDQFGPTDVLGGLFIKQAHQRYSQWGAVAKVQELGARYPQVLHVQDGTAARRSVRLDGTAVDFQALKRSLSMLAREKVHSRIIEKTLMACIGFAGAETGVLILPRLGNGELKVEGEYCIEDAQPRLMHALPVAECERMSLPVLQFVHRTGKSLVIHDAMAAQRWLPDLHRDIDIKRRKVRSILCMPIQAESDSGPVLSAILYLENNLAPGVFTEDRVEVLGVIGLTVATTLELSQEAATDGLTGLYNRRYFQALLEKEAQQALRHKRELSLIMVDVDSFKTFNDQWGHQAGDQVLAEVAHAIKQQVRGSDIVARYGGEEFGVILPETSLQGALAAAEQMRTAVANMQVRFNRRALKVTISAGVAALGADLTSPATLVEAADHALFQAKRSGRNRVCNQS